LSFAAGFAATDFSRRKPSAAIWAITVDPPRRKKNSQPPAARRVALKMGRLFSGGRRISHVSIHSTRCRLLMASPFDALSLAHGKPSEANEVNTGDTGRVRKRVECPEQATARRMGQICSFSASPARTASQTTHFERNETQGI
jgi:hypothetical protein